MSPRFRSDLGLVATCAVASVMGVAILYGIEFAFEAWYHRNDPTLSSMLPSISDIVAYGFMALPAGIICLLPYAYLLKWVHQRWDVTSWIAHVTLAAGYFAFCWALLSLYFDKGPASPGFENGTNYLEFAGIGVSAGLVFGTLFWLAARRPFKMSIGGAQ